MTDYIHVSNGDGVPVTAIVTTDRGIGSTNLIVDSVLNWATHGIAMSGTIDNDTGVITDKTVFKYHLEGSIIIIETFAAGYFDIGNTKDQVVVLKPTTEWGNEVAEAIDTLEANVTTATLTEITTDEIDTGTSIVLRAITGRMVRYIIDKISALVFLLAHPVNDIYISVNSANPGIAHGGTWVSWGSGRVPVGIDTGQTEFNTVEKTGGVKTQALVALIGAVNGNINAIGYRAKNASATTSYTYAITGSGAGISSINHGTYVLKDDGNEASTLQPFITCYMWKRTA